MDLEWNGVVLTISDRVSRGEAEDRSGPILTEGLKANGAGWVVQDKCSDDIAKIKAIVEYWVIRDADLLLTTGGTGIGPRDRTPEAIRPLLDRELPGIAEEFRRRSHLITPNAMLSRAFAGVAGHTLIVSLPGAPGACEDAVEYLFPTLLHGIAMIRGGDHS